jgi:hypothetical protein
MRKLWKVLVPGAALMVGVWAGMTPSYGKAEYTKQEKKPCTYCHIANGKKELNDAGKYYGEHNHSFKGYEEKK